MKKASFKKGIYLLPKPSSYLFFAGEDFEAISSFIIGLGNFEVDLRYCNEAGADLVQVCVCCLAQRSEFTGCSMTSAA